MSDQQNDELDGVIKTLEDKGISKEAIDKFLRKNPPKASRGPKLYRDQRWAMVIFRFKKSCWIYPD